MKVFATQMTLIVGFADTTILHFAFCICCQTQHNKPKFTSFYSISE